jgi:hypothetical protein
LVLGSLCFDLAQARVEFIVGQEKAKYKELRTKYQDQIISSQRPKIKDQRPSMKRQATLAIACLFLNLSRYLSIGGASEAVKYIPDGWVWQ